jgi:flagellum-specific peptidoglycan hydrolase FlgJ
VENGEEEIQAMIRNLKSSHRKRLSTQAQAVLGYISGIGPAARAAAQRTGVPAAYLIADSLLVSKLGTRPATVARGKLCDLYSLTERDRVDESSQGQYMTLREDYCFLGERISRMYPEAMRSKHDPIAFVRALEAGYFNPRDRTWADSLIKLIGTFKLTMWDAPARVSLSPSLPV